MNIIEIGKFIRAKRIEKHLTQQELATKLQISFQAVSKWETGITVPDTSLLLGLSEILEVTVDQILNAGEFRKPINKRINVEEVFDALRSIPKLKDVLGPNNHLYNRMMTGLVGMFRVDLDNAMADYNILETHAAKSVVQLIVDGYYIVEEDIEKYFRADKVKDAIIKYSKKYNS